MKTTVIIFADQKMLIGAETLLYSLHKHNDLQTTKIVFLTDDEETLESPILKRWVDEYRLIDSSPYERISYTKEQWGHKAYMKAFEAFRDYGTEQNILLDADMLCLGLIDHLLEPSDYDLRVVRDINDRARSHAGIDIDEFNSGMMAIHWRLLGDETVAELIERAATMESYDGGDEGILNHWAYDRELTIDYLPKKYNLLKVAVRDRAKERPLPDILSDCRLMHFTGDKPWLKNPIEFKNIHQYWHHVYKELQEEIF